MLSIGIVGLPNVGKSTLFNALLKSSLAEAANFAFTTIEPNVGIVEVPDERLEKLAEIENSARVVPTTIKFIDIAGIISGAHKGEGLGNKFLSHIREVDAIAQVVRCFENEKIVNVGGRVDPKSDIETIETELILADIETLERRLTQTKRGPTLNGDELGRKKLVAYEKVKKTLNSDKLAIEADLTDDEKNLVREANFLTIKPFIYVFNVDEKQATETPEDLIEKFGLTQQGHPEPACPEPVERVEGSHEIASSQAPRNDINAENSVVISAKIEEELSQLPEIDQIELLKEFGLEKPGLNRLVEVGYRALDLISFLTAGEMEARAWTVRRGAKAPEAAGKIHTDFAKKFIKAEVVSYDDFVGLGGWGKAKPAGKARLEGRNYEIKDGDVLFVHHG